MAKQGKKKTTAKRSGKQQTGAANTMWGGRFASAPAEIMSRINASIDVDIRLFAQDIAGSRAHCDMLAATGIISRKDAAAIRKGLDQIEKEIAAGQMALNPALEDIHMHVESRLAELIGDAAGRLHTARSRNDQVATDFRLWVRQAMDQMQDELASLQQALLARAEEHADTVMPGFTHLQTAQPVTFGHHLMAYVEMLHRDRSRLSDARKRLNESPLGAAALAGTSFPIDRQMTATALGFDKPMANSMDAVSDRDFALEFLSCLSILTVHLSRLAEEIVIYASAPFKFFELPDQFSTGSSIMPQKRNPDAAELVRAKTGRIIGAMSGLLIMLKGLPLAYSKDMQEDKEPTFMAFDASLLCVAAMTGMVRTLGVNKAAMERAASQGYSTATDLADWLVQNLNVPFRRAHHITGAIVRQAEARNLPLAALPLEDMQAIEPKITSDVFSVLGVKQSTASRKSLGGTAPANVRKAVKAARRKAAR